MVGDLQVQLDENRGSVKFVWGVSKIPFKRSFLGLRFRVSTGAIAAFPGGG